MAVGCSVDHAAVKSPFCPAVCPECHTVLPFRAGLTAFEIFGLTPAYSLDLKFVENRFFELSRILHPDKFATQNPDTLARSTQWFAALSTAYTTLRDPIERAEALFEAVGFKTTIDQKQVPAELAEDYFALKELVTEAQNKAPLMEFRKKIQFLLSECESQLKLAFDEWEKTQNQENQSEARAALEQAARLLNRRSYLVSMNNDLEQTCLKLSASI